MSKVARRLLTREILEPLLASIVIISLWSVSLSVLNVDILHSSAPAIISIVCVIHYAVVLRYIVLWGLAMNYCYVDTMTKVTGIVSIICTLYQGWVDIHSISFIVCVAMYLILGGLIDISKILIKKQ